MLLLNTEHWENKKILKLKCDHDWNSEKVTTNIDETMIKLKQYLEECVTNSTKCVLILNGYVGELPPMYELMRIVAFFVKIRHLIKEALDFTILYTKGEEKKWIDLIFSLYTPIRPVHIVSTKEDVNNLLKERQD